MLFSAPRQNQAGSQPCSTTREQVKGRLAGARANYRPTDRGFVKPKDIQGIHPTEKQSVRPFLLSPSRGALRVVYNRPVRLQLHAASIRHTESRALFVSSKESAKSTESVESEEPESASEESHHAETGGGVKADAAAAGAETTGEQNGAGENAGRGASGGARPRRAGPGGTRARDPQRARPTGHCGG
ncbi:hypothetical protein ACFWOL_22185 [Streptomyces sp. NPDC058442]|uniref:hypothetical protein n=1 Tax=Streptomyces sp. NPDC058442 TaxID=3346503 RepID=UPI00366A38A0